MIRRFARPYARAIMDAAGSPQKANELRGELMRFANALRSSTELMRRRGPTRHCALCG